jgi:hypothetical protein
VSWGFWDVRRYAFHLILAPGYDPEIGGMKGTWLVPCVCLLPHSSVHQTLNEYLTLTYWAGLGYEDVQDYEAIERDLLDLKPLILITLSRHSNSTMCERAWLTGIPGDDRHGPRRATVARMFVTLLHEFREDVGLGGSHSSAAQLCAEMAFNKTLSH